jgi:hypothetical protein
MHYKRWLKHGDTAKRYRISELGPSGHGANWGGAGITYRGAHRRVEGQRGLASEHSCAHCEGPAREWAYNHGDPNQKVGLNNGVACPYSIDPNFYIALCVRCHRAFDRRMSLG